MTAGDPRDPLLQALKRLPAPDVDATRAARIAERCHRALHRERRRRTLSDRYGFAAWQRLVEPAAILAACGVFLSEVIRRAVSLLE